MRSIALSMGCVALAVACEDGPDQVSLPLTEAPRPAETEAPDAFVAGDSKGFGDGVAEDDVGTAKFCAEVEENALGRTFEAGFTWVLDRYTASLDWALRHRWVIGAVAIASFVASAWLWIAIPKGFFPEEDIGQIQASTEASEDISFAAMTVRARTS